MIPARIGYWLACTILLAPAIHLLAGIFAPVDAENWGHIREFLIEPAVRDSLILTLSVCLLSLLLGVP